MGQCPEDSGKVACHGEIVQQKNAILSDMWTIGTRGGRWPPESSSKVVAF